MPIKIATKIQPLYNDLIKIGFGAFVDTNDFVRKCNTLGLTEIYTKAHNEGIEEFDLFDFSNLGKDANSDLLARFLNQLLLSDSMFSVKLASLISEYLKFTTVPIYPENILTDLQNLGLTGSDLSKLSNEFLLAQNDFLQKALHLKQIMISRATGMGGDEELYTRLRRDLVNNSSLTSYLPKFFSTCPTQSDFWQFIKSHVAQYQPRRDYLNESFAPLIAFLEKDNSSIVEITAIDNVYIQDAWKKAIDRLAQDPEGAITSARTLLETVCKHILDASGEQYDETADLPKLYKSAAKLLHLSPDQHTEQIFKQILSGCQSVVDGLGSMRNKLSDAHGKSSKAVKPSARHAGLAVNLSGGMCQFLLQTFEEKKNRIL